MARLSKEDYICPDCGAIGRAERKIRGSAAIERLLWYTLLLPGPLYSYWRRSGDKFECASCKSTFVVPLDSKLGEVMLKNKLEGK